MKDPEHRDTVPNELVGRDHYKLHELAEGLDAPIEQVRLWLREGDIEPLAADRPEEYGVDSLDLLRAMRTGV